MKIKQTQKIINIHHTTSVDGILYGRSESLTYDTNMSGLEITNTNFLAHG
jgi:hypothetical protein